MDGSSNFVAELALSNFIPQSEMVTRSNIPPAARFPAIDAHTHLGRWLSGWVGREGQWLVQDINSWLSAMADYNIQGFVNLDGRWGDELLANLDRFDNAYPGRFATFCHVDWSLLKTSDGPARIITSLRESARAGAAGIKVWKDLGLHVRDAAESLVLPDDPLLNDFWEVAGELNLPVWWHIADPVSFFRPVDGRNENVELLAARPEWSFFGPEFPSFDRLMESLEVVVSSHPRTTFVAVHGGCYAENLIWVSRMLDDYANLNIDIAARLAQLGRQPRATRELILRHQDRVLFGSDQVPPTGRDFITDPQYARHYQRHFRFLETADEGFAHSDDDPPLFGRWEISGLDLPDAALGAIYSGNVARLLPQLAGTSHFTQ